ncbi:unnamed protein product, partial [Heligmosomoides polygyrus]|uniref:Homeobox domain-containing protein n=1 Tax=Heligmosomoides polygyrus TaxID=6339 RepID=A0A183GKV5_HELPZ
MSASVPADYESFDLIDRYQMHRYPTAEAGPGAGPAGIASFHHRVVYAHPQPPPYHYAIPSSKSYQGSPLAAAGASHYQSYSSEYGAECPAAPTPAAQPARTGPAPDYYRMFNSWFAYSGEAGGNATLKVSSLTASRVIGSKRFEAEAQTGARISLRARKKLRRAGVKSELIHDQLDVVDLAPSSAVPIDKTSPPASQSRLQPSSLPSPQRLRTNSRLETAIDEPAAVELASNGDGASAATAAAFDYC